MGCNYIEAQRKYKSHRRPDPSEFMVEKPKYIPWALKKEIVGKIQQAKAVH